MTLSGNQGEDMLQAVLEQFDLVADRLKLDEKLRLILRSCKRDENPALAAAREKFDFGLFILKSRCFSSFGSKGRPWARASAEAGLLFSRVNMTRHCINGSVEIIRFI